MGLGRRAILPILVVFIVSLVVVLSPQSTVHSREGRNNEVKGFLVLCCAHFGNEKKLTVRISIEPLGGGAVRTENFGKKG